ncbi:MAG TPA: hypothetical protein DDW81_01490 [Cryomorphaceae bacterium]|nr:hypothetical protein [Cryomorphaceae bacterium]|tara:strand:- start:191 stop:739 length:549 start_codon:yes stop_codon:yes gene_type:complete
MAFSPHTLKRIPAIAMLLLLIIHMVGGGMYFHIQRSHIRKEIKTRIKRGVPQEELQVFHFQDESELDLLQWHNDHEFRSEGTMYDVVKRETRPDGIYLHCINDHQETVLFAQLNELVQKRCSQESNQEQRLLILSLASPYLNLHTSFIYGFQPFENRSRTAYDFALKTWVREIVGPPPRLIG